MISTAARKKDYQREIWGACQSPTGREVLQIAGYTYREVLSESCTIFGLVVCERVAKFKILVFQRVAKQTI